MPRRRPLIAVLSALLFLAAQQAAFVHVISHLGASGQAGVTASEAGHVAVDGLAEACTTCVALSALAGGAPLPAPVLGAPAVLAAVAPLPPARPFLAAAAAAPYLARAPPAVL